MAIFDDVDFDAQEEYLKSIMLRRSLGNNVDEEYAQDVYDTFTPTEPEDLTPVDTPQTRFQRNVLGGAVAALGMANSSFSEDDWETGGPKPEKPEITGSNIGELSISNPDWNLRERRRGTKDLLRMQSSDFAIGQAAERFWERDLPKMQPNEANDFARTLGADIKFDKPVSEFEVQQAVTTYVRREALDNAVSQLQSTGSQGFLNDATVLASGLAGGIGPVELGTSVLLGWAVPEATIASLAKAGKLSQTLLKAKKVADVSQKVKAAKTANTAIKAASSASNAEKTVVGVVLKNSAAGQKAAQLEARQARLMGTLRKMEGLKYDNLTALEKTALDSLVFTVSDLPFIHAARANSDALGFDLYTEKDAAADTLLASLLGIGVPAAFRGVGRALNITPTGLITRHLDEMDIDIDTKKALGEITEEEAASAKRAITQIKKDMSDMQSGVFKKPDQYFYDQVDELQKVNVSDETLNTQKLAAINAFKDGNRIKISALPEFESLMSHIDARVLAQLKELPAAQVFGSTLFREDTQMGLRRVRVEGDDALLGKYSVTGLNDEEALARLEELYKGFVLRDNNAALSFKQWANRFTELSNTLDNIYSRVRGQIDTNRAARREGGQRVTADNLVDVRREMRAAYLKYRLGDDAAQVEEALHANDMNRSLGFTDEALPENMQNVLEDFEEWYGRFVKEKRVKNGRVLYDFVDENGKADYGVTFNRYLSDLKLGAQDNAHLAETDNLISTWSSEKINNIVESYLKYDVSSDTDFENLFNAPRATYEELQNMARDNNAWRAQVSVQRLEYNKTKFGLESQRAFGILQRFSDPDGKTQSYFNDLTRRIDEIDEIRGKGFQDIKAQVVEKLRNTESFQRQVADVLDRGYVSQGLEYQLRDTLTEALTDTPVAKALGSTREVVNNVLELFRRELQEHPEKMEAFLAPEELNRRVDAPEWTGTQQRLEASVRTMTTLDSFLEPLDRGLNIELDRMQLSMMHDVNVMADKMNLMLQFPHIAAEVLTGAATQTIYNFDGAKRNVEYMTKTSGFYMNDLKNQLRSMESSTVKGQTLLDYYMNPSNKDDIMTAFIRLKHNETVDNTDASRIANAVLNQESSFLSSFRKFGSNYVAPSSTLSRSKMQYADAAMNDSEAQDLYETSQRALTFNAENILAPMPRVDAEGNIKRGNRVVPVDDKLRGEIADSIREMRGVFNDINKIENSMYRKMAWLAFRDFDLNRMFDRDATARIPLNRVRDAILNNDWGDIIGDDIQNFFEVVRSVKRIKTHLIGRNLEYIDGFACVSPVSWVYRFRNGFYDISAVTRGARAEALEAFEGGVHFKNADAEINASRLFGYDSVDEQIGASFSNMFQAYYTLENFGSRPIDMVYDLVNAFNAARRGEEQLAKDVAAIGANRGGGRAYEKTAITEGALSSIIENVMLNCGLQNRAPSTATRVWKAITMFLSSSLLVKAGLKSLSDYGTIWEGFITNGMANGRTEAMALAGEATAQVAANRDIMHLVLGSAILQQSEIFKKMSNDPGADIVALSKNASWVDRFEMAARRYSNFMMNSFAHLDSITNWNKKVAAWGIQNAIGKNAGTSYAELSDWFKIALRRESISGDDWDFLRQHAVRDINDVINENSTRKISGEGFDMFMPLELAKVDDKVFAEELARRGELNITPSRVADFKRNIIGKAWNIIETSSDEMVSIPSNRVLNLLRGGKARNSGMGTIIETATQYQSFGVAMLYNTYGRRLANLIDKETGISVIDILNPTVKLKTLEHGKWTVAGNVFGMMLSLAMAMLVVESAVNAMTGNIQRPIDKDGKIHADNIRSAMLGAMGAGGVVLDTAIEGFEGAGQRGGGFSMQIAPSVSNLLRTGYRLSQPLRSSRVPDSRKGSAFASGLAQEIARYTGLKTSPYTAMVYQWAVGSWLDSQYKGGRSPYGSYQRARERRGQIIMPWERDPTPVWERLQLTE